jgi:D-psicose/D-tagatose/L-ribulose 3-epimerase
MRISLCNEVIADLPFEQQCRLAAELGYDGIEIAPFTLGAESHRLSAGERKSIRKAATDAGIEITGFHYLLMAPAGLSITSPDPAIRTRTIAVVTELCALAGDLGAKLMVHGSPVQRQLSGPDDDEGRKRATNCFAAFAKSAEAAGLTYCVEPLSPDQTALINTVREAVTIVEAISSPALKTMIDCSSAARGGETESVAELIARWVPTGLIAHIHLNDPNRRGPGQGDLLFAPILAALQRHHYRGNAAIEPFVYQPDGATCAARSIGYIRGVLQAVTE